MIDTFKAFMEDSNAWDMYITGRAGTGKTTALAKLIEGLDNYVVCAYTHKACGILRDKLPTKTKIQTLHSFLKKRPTVNTDATIAKHITSSKVQGKSEEVQVMFIDEYSMIGEKDLMDLRALQDEDYDGKPNLKIVWIGDPYQLPPVGDMFTLNPHGDYQVTLTKVYRQAEDNPLKDVLEQVVSFIEGAPPCPLKESENFTRDVNISDPELVRPDDSIILAYTNKRVQEINAIMEGKDTPDMNDLLFSPTTKQTYMYLGDAEPDSITMPHTGEDLLLNTKYKTLEHLKTMPGIKFATVSDISGDMYDFAYVFGHANYLDRLKELKQLAAKSNQDIEQEFRGYKAAAWAKVNYSHPLARARSKAWRDFLTFNDCVTCLDFNHAMTIHKSQGSTYDTVYLDTQDLGQVAERDYDLYLKLMYVGLSRASNKVFTN